MDQQEAVADIELRAWEERVSIRFLCLRAGIHPSTFWRWKKTDHNPEPVNANLGTLKKLYAALDEIAAENRSKIARQGKAVAA